MRLVAGWSDWCSWSKVCGWDVWEGRGDSRTVGGTPEVVVRLEVEWKEWKVTTSWPQVRTVAGFF